VPFALAAALRGVGEVTGKPLAPLERFQTTDADEVLVAVGSAFPAARAAAEELRARGRRAGALGVRALRPFFAAEIVKTLARAKAVGVLEPLDVALAPCGPVAGMLKGAFADAITWAPGFPGVGHVPPIVSAGLATVDGAAPLTAARRVFEEIAHKDRAQRALVLGADEP
jgi:pyruvate-ferredoxin/flavodoxin oxidoreductase